MGRKEAAAFGILGLALAGLAAGGAEFSRPHVGDKVLVILTVPEDTYNVVANVTEIQPNHLLAISGSEELQHQGKPVSVSVQGVIRAQDISTFNSVTSDQIADARIVVDHKGALAK